MSRSLEDLIMEKIISFAAYLADFMGDKVSDEDLKSIAARLEEMGNKIIESLSDVSSRIHHLEDDNKYLRQRVSELTKENEDLKLQVENLRNELVKTKRRSRILRKKLMELRETESRLGDRIKELEIKIKELEEENRDLATKLAKAIEENDRLRDENKNLNSRLVDIDNLSKSLEERLRSFESKLLKAADIIRKELAMDVDEIRDAIKKIADELKPLVAPQGRAKLEKLPLLATKIHTKISSKDLGSAILRLIREGEV